MFTRHVYHQSIIFSLILLLILLPTLTACGGDITPVTSPTPLPNLPLDIKLIVAQVSPSTVGEGVTVLHAGESAAISVSIEPYQRLDNWTWDVSGTGGGQLNTSQGENVVYEA